MCANYDYVAFILSERVWLKHFIKTSAKTFSSCQQIARRYSARPIRHGSHRNYFVSTPFFFSILRSGRAIWILRNRTCVPQIVSAVNVVVYALMWMFARESFFFLRDNYVQCPDFIASAGLRVHSRGDVYLCLYRTVKQDCTVDLRLSAKQSFHLHGPKISEWSSILKWYLFLERNWIY